MGFTALGDKARKNRLPRQESWAIALVFACAAGVSLHEGLPVTFNADGDLLPANDGGQFPLGIVTVGSKGFWNPKEVTVLTYFLADARGAADGAITVGDLVVCSGVDAAGFPLHKKAVSGDYAVGIALASAAAGGETRVGITRMPILVGTKTSIVSTEIPVTSIDLVVDNSSIAVGAVATITATTLPANATDTAVEYGSSNTAVATVDQTGKVTGVSVGTTVITVSAKDGAGASKSINIEVTA